MRKIFSKMKTTFLTGASDHALFPSSMRARDGRKLRDPDGHAADAGGDAGGAGGAAAPAAPAGGGEGGDAGPGAEGAGAAPAGGAAPETVLGEAAAEGDAPALDAEGKPIAKPEGEGEGGEKKEGEEGAPAKVEVLGAPEKYEIVVPPDLAETGMTFDAEAFAAVEPELRALDLSNDAAQALVGAYATKVLPLLEARANDRADAFGVELKANMLAEAKADPEIGGAKFDETKALCKQTFLKFGVKPDSPFLALLEETGLGNNVEMLRVMANVARATGETTVHKDGGGGGAKRLADRVYGAPVKPE